MFLLTKNISTRDNESLKTEVKAFIELQPKIKCKALNARSVFLTKYMQAITNRRDKNRRLAVFFVCVELIKKLPRKELPNIKKTPQGLSFELQGIMQDGTEVGVHIREEVDAKLKNKQLFLISTFSK